MAKFSKRFSDWIKEDGFYINDLWDTDKQVDGGSGKLELLYPWNVILDHVLEQDERGVFPYTTVILSAPKKSAKTVSSAVITAWYAECSPDGTELYVCANSEDQSTRLIFKDLTYHFNHREGIKVLKDRIVLPNGTVVQVLPKNYTSNAGGRHSLVVWDELWGAVSDNDYRRYDELTPIPTIPHSLQLVTSYAGFYGESQLLYDLYLNAVGKEENEDGKGELIEEFDGLPCYRNGNAFFAYWDHEPRMPWQTPEYYASQARTMRDSAYIRLHENRWVTSNEVFFPIEWWDKGVEAFTDYCHNWLESREMPIKDPQSADVWLNHPYIKSPVYVAVDTGMKHDCTAIVGVTTDPSEGKGIILFHKIWTPVDGEVLDLDDTVKPYLIEMNKKYNIAEITCDPSQMLQTMVELRSIGLPVTEFTQSESNMIAASQALFDLLHDQNLWSYGSDELREHLQNAIALHTSRGFRIVKDKSNRRMARKKVDAAIAMAMAFYKALGNMDFDAGEVIMIESPFGEYTSTSYVSPEERNIPWQLRD